MRVHAITTVIGISVLAICVMTIGCSAKLSHRSGSTMKHRDYNAEIERQGNDFYCHGGGCDEAPRLLNGAAPVYPRAAVKSRSDGFAAVSFDIAPSGRVENVVVEESTDDSFGSAAKLAVEAWTYRPAKLKGNPVRLRVRQEFPFSY